MATKLLTPPLDPAAALPQPTLRSSSNTQLIMSGIGNFITGNIGWTFNFVVATIWFWAFGFPKVNTYGYDTSQNAISTNSGAVESGAYGSGVFPVTLILWSLATLTWGRGLMKAML